MPKSLTLKEAYNQCSSEGKYLPQKDIDYARVETTLKIIEEDLETIKELKMKKDRWNTLYKLNYDVIHTLVEAFLVFDNIKSTNHQCLFACLCTKHPQLELSWDFFEKVRTKRNGIHYYGTGVNEQDWKEVELRFSLYINLLSEEIKKKL
ncbi:hypothetical protein ACFLZN_02220 [Nanoarchaeota archaeon]